MALLTTQNSRGTFVAAVDLFSTTGTGTPIEVTDCDVTVQVNGTATSITGRVERSTVYPGADGSLGNWAPVDSAFSGDLTAGVNALVYVESDHAWWRIRVSVLSGGTATSSVSGRFYK